MRLNKNLIFLFSLSLFIGFVLCIYKTTLSDLFIFDTIELQHSVEPPPCDIQPTLEWVKDQFWKKKLLHLDMKKMELKFLAQEWIHSVYLEKRMPRTLFISVKYRKPRVLVQDLRGFLAYADSEGHVFGKVSLPAIEDLPLLSGFMHSAAASLPSGGGTKNKSLSYSTKKIKEALFFLEVWDSSDLTKISQLSSVHWDGDKGFRMLITYTFNKRDGVKSSVRNNRVPVILELGKEIETHLTEKFDQLYLVFQYLSTHAIEARLVWADIGKRIVVKKVSDS